VAQYPATIIIKLNPINASGCIAIAASVYQYSIVHGQAVTEAQHPRRRHVEGLPK
jgi:hypothetical protein